MHDSWTGPAFKLVFELVFEQSHLLTLAACDVVYVNCYKLGLETNLARQCIMCP